MLEKIKKMLNITHDDEDAKLEQIIEFGKNFLCGQVEKELDFEKNISAYELLVNYCRYYYNNVSDLFTEDYCRQLLTFQLQEGVENVE